MNFFSSEFFCSICPRRTDGRAEGDAQEPTVHEHRWAQLLSLISINLVHDSVTCTKKTYNCYNFMQYIPTVFNLRERLQH